MSLHAAEPPDEGFDPGREAPQAAANRWVSAQPRPIGASFGGALLLELALIGGLLWWSAHRLRTAPLPPRVPVRVAAAPTPLPPVPLPQAPPMPALSPLASPPVIALPSTQPLAEPRFTVPVAPPPPPAAAGASSADLLARYTAELNAAVQSGLRVPGMVRAMRLHGTATVLFKLTPSGQLLWAQLARSSGVPQIDDAAMAKVRATAYPPFPVALGREDMTFEIEVKLTTDNQ